MTVQVAVQAAFQAAVQTPVLRWMMKQQCHGTEMDVSGLGEGRFLQKAITEVDSFARVIRACLRHDLDPGSAMNFRSVFDVDQ